MKMPYLEDSVETLCSKSRTDLNPNQVLSESFSPSLFVSRDVDPMLF